MNDTYFNVIFQHLDLSYGCKSQNIHRNNWPEWPNHNAPDNTLLKSDVTRRDHVSVVMDAGSHIVNFIRDGTVFA